MGQQCVFIINKKISTLVLSFLLIAACYFLTKDLQFEYKWNKIAKRSLAGQTSEMIPSYEGLYNNWNGNHLFLYNYAAELNTVGSNHKSLEVLQRTTDYWNDYDIQMLMSDNYRELEDWCNSEKHLNIAMNMCPNRFLPLFYLHEIYVRTSRPNKALEIAKRIIKKEVKIESSNFFYY